MVHGESNGLLGPMAPMLGGRGGSAQSGGSARLGGFSQTGCPRPPARVWPPGGVRSVLLGRGFSTQAACLLMGAASVSLGGAFLVLTAPLEGDGFAFLLAVAFGVLALVTRTIDGFAQPHVPRPKVALGPYHLAFLAGGAERVARVACLSLLHRGVLQTNGRSVWMASSPNDLGVSHTSPGEAWAESAVVLAADRPVSGGALVSSAAQSPAVLALGQRLFEAGLMEHSTRRRHRRVALVTFWAAIWATLLFDRWAFFAPSDARIGALPWVVFASLVWFGVEAWQGWKAHKRPSGWVPTRAGNLVLKGLRTEFGPLRIRSSSLSPGQAPGDFTVVAALFGRQKLPRPAAAMLESWALRPALPYNSPLWLGGKQPSTEGAANGSSSSEFWESDEGPESGGFFESGDGGDSGSAGDASDSGSSGDGGDSGGDGD